MNRGFHSVVFKSGQKMAIKVLYAVKCPRYCEHLWNKMLSSVSFLVAINRFCLDQKPPSPFLSLIVRRTLSHHFYCYRNWNWRYWPSTIGDGKISYMEYLTLSTIEFWNLRNSTHNWQWWMIGPSCVYKQTTVLPDIEKTSFFGGFLYFLAFLINASFAEVD